MFLGARGNDRQAVDIAFVSHVITPLPLQHIGQTAVDQLVRAFGIDIALVVHPQGELGQVLRGVAPDLLATLLAVEPAEMAGTVQSFV
ncbi:hypothetical protein D3C72_2243830 [compost metagenome]